MKPSDVRRLRSGLAKSSAYRSLLRSLVVYRRPVDAVRRYVNTDRGSYPWTITVRTPTGPLPLALPHPHDLRTVNEVFCRRDYGRGKPRIVVDIGANIGISSAYFLSRRSDSVVYCWEPVPANLLTLRANVERFGKRCVVHENAMSILAGPADFFVEPIGRYSGLADHYIHEGLATTRVRVCCDAISAALDEVIGLEGFIDLVKIDTEGNEAALVAAIPTRQLSAIGLIRYEDGSSVHAVSGAELLAQRAS